MNHHSDLIYDVGMHQGRDTEYYLAKGFRVVAIEANEDLVAKATEQFASQIRDGRLTIVNKAIVDDDATEVTFFTNSKKNDWGTLRPDWNRTLNQSFQEVRVSATRLDEILAVHGVPHYMKIDIEGADVFCLRSLLRVGERPRHISLELMTPNNLAGQQVDSLDILTHLRMLGYDNFRVSDQSKLAKIKCVQPAQEGEFVDCAFDGFTSGPFGKELHAETLAFDEICHAYLDYFYGRRGRLIPKLSAGGGPYFHAKGWFDVHAESPLDADSMTRAAQRAA